MSTAGISAQWVKPLIFASIRLYFLGAQAVPNLTKRGVVVRFFANGSDGR
jgi:hypothetical protein